LAHRLSIDLGTLAEGLRLGASVCVNGACLTLAEQGGTVGGFDVVPETWRRTALRGLRAGDPVNLERSLRVGDPLDGHFVLGHVEGVGVVDRVERGSGEWKLWVHAEPALMPAIVPKGSIALDGTSLTVVDAIENRFSVALVPTTLERTVLGRRGPGDQLNIETDILARLVARRLLALVGDSSAVGSGLSWDKLREGGWLP
jgi:riboflavin synthase